jgi:hypothetical protein
MLKNETSTKFSTGASGRMGTIQRKKYPKRWYPMTSYPICSESYDDIDDTFSTSSFDLIMLTSEETKKSYGGDDG